MSNVPSDDSPARRFIDATIFSLFTQKGVDALDKQIKEHADDLVEESIRIMKRHHAESITEVYVRHASSRISSGPRKKQYSMAGSLGGVFLGAAVSSFIDMANAANRIEFQFVLIASTMAVVGTIMMAVNFFKE